MEDFLMDELEIMMFDTDNPEDEYPFDAIIDLSMVLWARQNVENPDQSVIMLQGDLQSIRLNIKINHLKTLIKNAKKH
jgi:hypothetical protein